LALGEFQANIIALERQQEDPVRLPLLEAAQAPVKVLLVTAHGKTNRRMNDKGDTFALADFFDVLELQHC
jgi:hypothetical protein